MGWREKLGALEHAEASHRIPALVLFQFVLRAPAPCTWPPAHRWYLVHRAAQGKLKAAGSRRGCTQVEVDRWCLQNDSIPCGFGAHIRSSCAFFFFENAYLGTFLPLPG